MARGICVHSLMMELLWDRHKVEVRIEFDSAIMGCIVGRGRLRARTSGDGLSRKTLIFKNEKIVKLFTPPFDQGST